MKVTVFGAGAIGGLLAARLARAGDCELSVIARGDTLEAIRQRGIVLETADETVRADVRATERAAELGPQDYVIVALKAQVGARVVPVIRELLGPDTAVVTASNGIPWWYFHGIDSPYHAGPLESVDPEGVQWRGIGPERAIGCVVYPAAETVAPARIRLIWGDRFVLGEPDGSRTERVRQLSELLARAGFKAPIRPRIREEIWLKLWGNLSFNPISALTLAPLDMLATSPDTRPVARRMMLEAQAIAERLGVRFPIDVDRRIDGAVSVGAHKTSMLQDLERGRPMEIDALVTVVQELGRLVGVPTPTIDTVLGLVRLRARIAGCYP